MEKNEIYLHYGDASHTPLHTVRFHGGLSKLQRLMREAKREKRPLRVQATLADGTQVIFTSTSDVGSHILGLKPPRRR